MTEKKAAYLRTLIVDDSRVSRAVTAELLRKAGFKHLDEAENADEAYAKMDALKYDLVFLDWMMPGKSGISLLGEWREDNRFDDVAVIVASMQDHKGLIAGAIKAGALSYIIKPVTEEKMRDSLDKAMKFLDARRAAKEQD